MFQGTLPGIPVTDQLLRKHFRSLFLLVEPVNIADELFQAGHINVFEHEVVTCSNKRYKRLKELLAVLSKKSLYTHFVSILQSLDYSDVLHTLKMNEPFDLKTCK